MMPGLEQCAIEIASCARLATEMSVPPSIIPGRSGERTRWCAACGGACRIAENSKKFKGGQKVTRGSSDHHIPRSPTCQPRESVESSCDGGPLCSSGILNFNSIPRSTSPPGGERVAVSSGGEGATVRATRTSPRHAPHPWGQACAAGAARAHQKLCADQPWCGPNAHHVRGDRSGPLGMRPRCLGSMQN